MGLIPRHSANSVGRVYSPRPHSHATIAIAVAKDNRSNDRYVSQQGMVRQRLLWLVLFLSAGQASWYAFTKHEPTFGFVQTGVSEPGGLSILMAVFNKAHYLNRSIASILRLRLAHWRIVAIDDGSKDDSVAVVNRFARQDIRIKVYRNPKNLGTHRTRLRAIGLTQTPFLTFLDPDDELTDPGVRQALQFIQSHRVDVVEMGCQRVGPTGHHVSAMCWKPPTVSRTRSSQHMTVFFDGRENGNLCRKIFRTDLYKRAIATMPPWLKEYRLLRSEDVLHYSFITRAMQRDFVYSHSLGYVRYAGLPDSSGSQTYYSTAEMERQHQFVCHLINATFGRQLVIC